MVPMPKPVTLHTRNREHRGSSHERGYNARWRKARATYLSAHPHCCYCARDGRVTAATVVDHKVPHKGNQALFWDVRNWQPLCIPCHSSAKQREEGKGYSTEVDSSGWPTDPRHPANRV